MSIRKDNAEVREKGLYTGNSPYLSGEVTPQGYMDPDTRTERFAHFSTGYSVEESKGKRVMKYIIIGVVIVFLIAVFVAIWLENPQTLFRGDTGRGHFFS